MGWKVSQYSVALMIGTATDCSALLAKQTVTPSIDSYYQTDGNRFDRIEQRVAMQRDRAAAAVRSANRCVECAQRQVASADRRDRQRAEHSELAATIDADVDTVTAFRHARGRQRAADRRLTAESNLEDTQSALRAGHRSSAGAEADLIASQAEIARGRAMSVDAERLSSRDIAAGEP